MHRYSSLVSLVLVFVLPQMLTQPGQKCVIVPHTFAAGPLAEWNWPNADFDCLLEIYQGCLGSYEKWNQPPGEMRRVDIIKNGMHVYTKEPRGKTFETVFRDFDVTPGKAYYYVRVLQRDPEAPDGDPEIAWSSPIFVRYR